MSKKDQTVADIKKTDTATKETPKAAAGDKAADASTEAPKEEEKEEVKKPDIPEALMPSDIPEEIVTGKVGKPRKVKPKYKTLTLKDFNSMRWRPAILGDVDMLGKQVPVGDMILCIWKAGSVIADLKGMPVLYKTEEVKDEDGKVVQTLRTAWKKAQIRKTDKGTNIGGELHNQYKQHTVILMVEEPQTDEEKAAGKEVEFHGHVGYWNTALTPSDIKHLAEKEAKKIADAKEKEEKKEAKKLEAAAKAKAALEAEAEKEAEAKAGENKTEPAAAGKEEVTSTKKEEVKA